jgi:predicted MPP superfamily phosphohydrolase
MLYLLFSVLLVDLLRLVFKTSSQIYGLAALLLALLVSVYGITNAFMVRTQQLELSMPGLGKEIRLMHWTDVHLGHFRGPSFLEKLVNNTNAEEVDMVLITGDLFDGKIRFGDASLEVLKHLEAPVYFVAGNHDGYSGVEDVKNGLREVGIHVLSNQVTREGEIQLIGLNHMLADINRTDIHAMDGHGTIRSVLDSLQVDPDMPSILLHHSPDGVQYAQRKGINLYLSGHTHAGQLFPVTLIGELIYDYNKGLHELGATRIFVGEGAGTFGPPMRVGTRSTITCITLKREK